MQHLELNLARKWRSKTFKEVVGQDLVLKILQNSLYKKAFFPVYLFSGQRGCGKTTTARLFAAAVNCQQLEQFQKNPKVVTVPCLACPSCLAMGQMRHPDFIEIDAASYTGVDNIRNIIDTSSFLPVLSCKKIYLIDEVHMLSKAAFNALLKILEEPPKSVMFLLATTEIQKIPETVKSRCFQLFFNPVQSQSMVSHLQHMCEREQIAHEVEALQLIAQASDGSLRDAINLLEQARFAGEAVTKKLLYSVLGYVDDAHIWAIVQALLQKDRVALMQIMQTLHEQAVATDFMLARLQECLYDSMMVKYHIAPSFHQTLPESLVQSIEQVALSEVITYFQGLLHLETLLAQTGKKQLVFQAHLLTLILQPAVCEDAKKKIVTIDSLSVQQDVEQHKWQQFLDLLGYEVDPIVYAMLCGSTFVGFELQKKLVRISVLKKFMLFQDLFAAHKKSYQPLLERCFGPQVLLYVDFDQQPKVAVAVPTQKVAGAGSMQVSKKNTIEKLEIADSQKWALTQALLKHFGGTVSDMGKDNHEPNA